jgi:membrane dipeptidase
VIVDAHNDVILELVGEDVLALREGLFERYWLPELEAAGVGVQICPLYGACELGPGARERALAQHAELRRSVEANAERVCLASTAADLDDPRLRLVLAMEGMEPLEGDPEAFGEWHALGVRSAQLTWNHPNEFAGGTYTPDQGLTDRGRQLVRRFAELGVDLDLSHASDQTWRDVVEEDVAFSVTHAGCRAVFDHPRNLTDWQLQAVAERGGVVGMMGMAFNVDPEAPTLARWLDHFDHAVAVMGVDHVGIGADFIAPTDGPHWLEGFSAPRDYAALAQALEQRGYEPVLSANWLRVLRERLR